MSRIRDSFQTLTLAALSAHTFAAALPLLAVWSELGPGARAALASAGRDELGLALAVFAVMGLAVGVRRDDKATVTKRSNPLIQRAKLNASAGLATQPAAPSQRPEAGCGSTSEFVQARLAALRA